MGRTTRVLRLDPDAPDPALVAEAARVLARGGLVAFPTETVYGLGAHAADADAVGRIFEAKGRPASNPLIVHVSGVAMGRRCVAEGECPEAVEALWGRWWPGPVSFVHRRSSLIPDVVTAGGPTVGLRMPRSRVALALIEALGGPVAAPSANRSTGISPTRAEHVLKDLDGRIDLVLDAGPAAVGIESTVVDATGPSPRILRPGPVTLDDLGGAGLGLGLAPRPERAAGLSAEGPAASPGQSRVHYAPRTPAYWVEPALLDAFRPPGRGGLLVVGGHPVPTPAGCVRRIELDTPEEAARRLYDALHELDDAGLDHLLVVPPPDLPAWGAVRDRLWRATLPAG